jgi:hypothetical protein
MKFTRLTGTLYGQEQIIYNIQILQHVVESVWHCGTPWANSAFIYEDAGGLVQRQFQGSKTLHAILQFTLPCNFLSKIMAQARLRRQFASR